MVEILFLYHINLQILMQFLGNLLQLKSTNKITANYCNSSKIHKNSYLEINTQNSLVLAGLGGFEPPKCQSQSLVPYRLATAQYVIYMG